MAIKKATLPLCSRPCVDEGKVKEAMRRMPDAETVGQLADFFDAFSDRTRARILIALAVSRLCVCDISRSLGMSVSAISHQLRILRNLRLIKYTCKGRLVFYELADAHVRKILEVGLAHIKEPEKL